VYACETSKTIIDCFNEIWYIILFRLKSVYGTKKVCELFGHVRFFSYLCTEIEKVST
jgi:hypothetical protein